MAVGGQDVLCVKQKSSSPIPPAELKGYLEELGDCLFSDTNSPILERTTKNNQRKVCVDLCNSCWALCMLSFAYSTAISYPILLIPEVQVPEVFGRMLQTHTMQFTSITETSSKDVSCFSTIFIRSVKFEGFDYFC